MSQGPTIYGRYFDGDSGERLDVSLHVDIAAETLRLSHPDLPHGAQYWPLQAIRKLSDQARPDQCVLSLFDDGALDSALIATARLTVADASLIRRLEAHCKNLNRRDRKRGTLRKVLTYATGAAASVLMMLFVIIPALAGSLASMIPLEREVAYGKSVVSQMERFLGGQKRDGGLVCRNADGVDALNQMRMRLTDATETEYALDIRVFDHGMVNAFAAPGGQIVLMRGLIDKAKGPDEVAAVLAHEIGHVEARDVTRNALRVAGSAGLLSMVIGDFSGGTAGVVLAEHMLNSSYTREAEANADLFALNVLAAAQVDTNAMADFFDGLATLEKRAPAIPGYLTSHPDTAARAQSARDFAGAQDMTTPILSAAEWAALQNICK